MGGCLISWFVKCNIQISVFFQAREMTILKHPLLPDWLCSPLVGGIIYFAPMLCVMGLLARRAMWMRLCAIIYTTCSLLMLWHIQSFNDATEVTGFWTGLWLLWWAGKVHAEDEKSLWHGVSIAVAVVSLCWLGGGLGKLTSEYWSGEPFYHLYFMDKPQFPFSWFRNNLSTDTIHILATGFSRIVVITELVLATCFLWPAKWAVLASLSILSLMVIISQLQLFSVLGSLMALSIGVAWILEKEAPKFSSSSTSS